MVYPGSFLLLTHLIKVGEHGLDELAVPVEVARTSDAPPCPYRSQTDRGLKGGAIHEPDNALASRVVLPKDIRLAVPVEVFVCAGNSRCWYWCRPAKLNLPMRVAHEALLVVG
jgi:hypothetical protein